VIALLICLKSKPNNAIISHPATSPPPTDGDPDAPIECLLFFHRYFSYPSKCFAIWSSASVIRGGRWKRGTRWSFSFSKQILASLGAYFPRPVSATDTATMR
jgi:hypothetical protein